VINVSSVVKCAHPQSEPALPCSVSAGEAGLELVENMDKYVSGFISGFERRYSRLEKVIKTTLTRTVRQSLTSPSRRAAPLADTPKGRKQARV
jgi:hypothetical protein